MEMYLIFTLFLWVMYMVCYTIPMSIINGMRYSSFWVGFQTFFRAMLVVTIATLIWPAVILWLLFSGIMWLLTKFFKLFR